MKQKCINIYPKKIDYYITLYNTLFIIKMSAIYSLDKGIENYESDSDDSICENKIMQRAIKNPFFNRDKVIIEDGYVKLIDLK